MTDEQKEKKAKENVNRFDTVDFMLLLPVTICADVASIVPVIGNVISAFTLALLRLAFSLKDVKPKSMNMLFAASLGVEIIPLLSIFPGATGYLIIVFILNRTENTVLDKLADEALPAKKVAEKAIAQIDRKGAEGSAESSNKSARSKGVESQEARFSSDTDQFGTRMGPEGEFGVSGGPTAQPNSQRERSHQSGASAQPRASSSEPTNAVLRARQAAQGEATQEGSVEGILKERQVDPSKDQFGQRGPTNLKKSPVATDWPGNSKKNS